jgi:hypothetical protein
MSNSRLAQFCIMDSGFLTLKGTSVSSNKLLLSPVMPCRGDFNSWLNMAMIEALRASRSCSQGGFQAGFPWFFHSVQ